MVSCVQDVSGLLLSLVTFPSLLVGREAEVEGNRVMMFGTDDHLKLLCQSPIWLGKKTKTIHYALILNSFQLTVHLIRFPRFRKKLSTNW